MNRQEFLALFSLLKQKFVGRATSYTSLNIALRNNNFTINFIVSFLFLFSQSTFFILLYRKNRYKNSFTWFHQVHKFYFQFWLFIVDLFSYLRIYLLCSLYAYCSHINIYWLVSCLYTFEPFVYFAIIDTHWLKFPNLRNVIMLDKLMKWIVSRGILFFLLILVPYVPYILHCIIILSSISNVVILMKS